MAALKLRAIGNSVGVVLPKDLLSALNVREGDELHVTRTPYGVTLSTLEPETERQVAIGREIMRKYRAVFAALAK